MNYANNPVMQKSKNIALTCVSAIEKKTINKFGRVTYIWGNSPPTAQHTEPTQNFIKLCYAIEEALQVCVIELFGLG
jgi:hypothetical protein